MSDYLVDTSVWVEYFRGKKIAVKKRLEKLLDENRAVVTGIVLAELLTGVSTEKDQHFLEECFLGLPYLEASREIFSAAGKMGATLRRKGITMPLTDLVIAALARTNALTVLTMDNHFNVLARPLNVQMELLKGF
jgi:predicted nucleic acid-binding protein